MDTPICDFVRGYTQSGALRLHMPGHKGSGPLGLEALDITEIAGADSLYEADGIIRRSEQNAGQLFGAHTFYSAEGSSLCIRAMLALVQWYARGQGKRARVLAGRNAHKVFLSAAALLDLDVCFITPGRQDAYLSCAVDAQTLEAHLRALDPKPVAVYLTSPDYLGQTVDVSALAKVCHRHGILLLVDNAHGAYLRFLPVSRHPLDLGADLCCDSAHKTLPVITGGAYLHISPSAPPMMWGQARQALALFGSTSPSYLILQSLDAANWLLAEEYPRRLAAFASEVESAKAGLRGQGWQTVGDEPLKLTLRTKPFGYRGTEVADALSERRIFCEFADPDFVVMMVTPQTGREGLERLACALGKMQRRRAIEEQPPALGRAQPVMSVREAMMSAREEVPVERCEGRVLASASVGCPPAVPIVVCGERIDSAAIACFQYYGIRRCSVVAD